MRWGQIAIIAIVIGIVAFFAVGLHLRGQSQPASGAAPEFTLSSFDGKSSYTLTQLRGKVVVVNFWASWCDPCREEADLLEKTWRSHKDRGVVFVGVDWSDPEPDALKYVAQYQLSYFSGPDLGTKVGQAYRIRGVPETYFVDKKGNLRGNALGPITPTSGFMTEAQFVTKIEELLGERE